MQGIAKKMLMDYGLLLPDTVFFLCFTIGSLAWQQLELERYQLAASKDLADSQFVWCSIAWPSGMPLVRFS